MRKITTAEAAKRMGVSAEFVRVGLQTGKLPIGTAFKRPGSSIYRYFISEKLLDEFIGKEVNDGESC